MKEKIDYLKYAVSNKYRMITHSSKKIVYKKMKYGNKQFLDGQSGNDKITELLNSKSPFMVARFGSTELAIMRQCMEMKLGIRKYLQTDLRRQFQNWSGFFPDNVDLITEFSELMLKSCSLVDLLGVWYNPMEDYFVSKYNDAMVTTELTGLEPWYHNNPWSKCLKGKKVLVIHPFAETIQKQYKKKGFIYSGDLLPEFELYTVKAVQTIAGEKDERFKTWFEALDYMYEESVKINFDVAIIGCGAYGFPLAAKIKNRGKQAIHLGGPTQLLFGIKGKRWDERPEVAKFYNEYWVRPGASEGVNKKSIVEGGCYW